MVEMPTGPILEKGHSDEPLRGYQILRQPGWGFLLAAEQRFSPVGVWFSKNANVMFFGRQGEFRQGYFGSGHVELSWHENHKCFRVTKSKKTSDVGWVTGNGFLTRCWFHKCFASQNLGMMILIYAIRGLEPPIRHCWFSSLTLLVKSIKVPYCGGRQKPKTGTCPSSVTLGT